MFYIAILVIESDVFYYSRFRIGNIIHIGIERLYWHFGAILSPNLDNLNIADKPGLVKSWSGKLIQ